MGLKNDVSGIGLQKLEVAYRPPALYNAGANIIFVIRGGPVLIMALFAHTIQAMGAGSTFTMTVSGAPVDSGAIVVTSAINTLIVSPLDPTLLWPIVPNVAVNAGMAGGFMLLAVPGNIVLNVAIANTTGTMAWYCAYYRMNPVSDVTP